MCRSASKNIHEPGCSSDISGSAYVPPCTHIQGPHAWFCCRLSTTHCVPPHAVLSAITLERMARQPSHCAYLMREAIRGHQGPSGAIMDHQGST